ncbi:DUF6053 domain-containing protein [Lysobacter enzymogenes]|uniref:DUF6053 domain-containing protein n=1 Tax=Lysobacter enzymogenes TaxID=69 RepID=UPI003D18A55E
MEGGSAWTLSARFAASRNKSVGTEIPPTTQLRERPGRRARKKPTTASATAAIMRGAAAPALESPDPP